MNALLMQSYAMILLFLENSILQTIICVCGYRQNPIKQQNYPLSLQVSKKAYILEVQQFDLFICQQLKVIWRHCLKCARKNDSLYKRHRINIQKWNWHYDDKEIFAILFIMSFYSRDNPFKRQSNLIPQPYPRRYHTQHYTNNQGQATNQDLQSKSRVLIDSPFEKSRFEDVFSGKNNKSQSRLVITPIVSDYGHQPSIPLSRYESRMRLRQIDNENWKREKLNEQKYKLEHFGPQALRYKSYSTGHSSLNQFELNSRANQNKYREQESRQGSTTRRKYDQNPQSSYMLYFDKSQNTSAKNAQSNTSISNMKTQHHNSGYFGQRSLHSGINQSTQKYQQDNQGFQIKKNGNQHKQKANHSHARNYSKDFDQVNRSENKNYRSDYELEYWNNSKRQDEKYNGTKGHYESKRVQKRQTPTFNNNSKEYMQNSFNKSSQKGNSHEIHIDRQMSSKSFDSNSDLINQNFYGSKGQPDKKSMSYGSNEQKDKPNFEDSDYIRQNDEQPEPGISKAMKFSSSFEQDSGKRLKPSHFGFKRNQNPNRIIYADRQFYLLNII